MGICIRLSALAAGSRLTSSNTSSPMGCRAISSILVGSESRARSRERSSNWRHRCSREAVEPHRQAGGQRIDVVEPVVEVELPEHRGRAYGELLTETGGEGHVLLARPSVCKMASA